MSSKIYNLCDECGKDEIQIRKPGEGIMDDYWIAIWPGGDHPGYDACSWECAARLCISEAGEAPPPEYKQQQ